MVAVSLEVSGGAPGFAVSLVSTAAGGGGLLLPLPTASAPTGGIALVARCFVEGMLLVLGYRYLAYGKEDPNSPLPVTLANILPLDGSAKAVDHSLMPEDTRVA